MKVLNLLTSGGLGGIEILNYDLGKYSSEDNGFAFLFGTGLTYDRMKNNGFEVYDLSGYHPKISLKRYRKLAEIANRYDIITVHHGDPYLKAYYCAIVAKCHKKGVTFVHSCWDDSLFFPKSKVKHFFGKMIFQKALNIAEITIFVSEAGKESYEKAFKLKNKTQVIYNGIGTDKIEDGTNNVVKISNPLELVYVGRIEKIKGIDLLIDALNELKNEYDFHLTIVGEGSQKVFLENKVKELNLNDRIELIGGRTDVKPYLRQGSIFIYPSICQEVFGIAIVEAMSYGLICVANNVGGIPEVLHDGINGFVNKTNDISGLKIALRKAFEAFKTKEYEVLGNKAKQTAMRFSITNTCKNLDAVYEDLINHNGD